ncbi:diguanylate cyclase domain-containing protein [Burkholderia vietnamiensis]|uniref:diguanylate cyclase domain-containing protein n=1 Tax=Burkholderia vietnamiensis TaxID=60552 RepID=UPI001BA1FF2F|nr:diguanylate cyclase [Burkholderia vietnamiensis]MBR8034488.1 diguanylate cyclase [Burkholderia vietnamiensis]
MESRKPLVPITAAQRIVLRTMIFEHCPDGIVITDARGCAIESNTSFTRMTGYRPDEIRGKALLRLWTRHFDRTLYRIIRRSIASTGCWEGEMPDPLAHNYEHRYPLRINVIRGEHGKTTALIWTLIDDTRLSDMRREMVRLAHHDPLTGLPNRLLLMSRLEHMHDRFRKDIPGAVLFVDLDGFKLVNDTFGHKTGDKLLQAVTARLSARLRHTDMLARLGGDEFVIVLEQIAHERDAATVAEHIIQQIHTPFTLADGTIVHIGASVGIALLPQDGKNADQLLEHADRALYSAKRAGKGAYRFFESQQTEDAR